MRRLRLVGYIFFVGAFVILLYIGIQLYLINNLHNFTLGQFNNISTYLEFIALGLAIVGSVIRLITKEPKSKQTHS
jgi:predicted tellurium resistance membrane protein TerC